VQEGLVMALLAFLESKIEVGLYTKGPIAFCGLTESCYSWRKLE